MIALTTAEPVNFSVDLTGQVALVTGASAGLGERFARVLAACGAKVAVAARRKDRLERLVADIAADGGTARAFALDMRDETRIAEVAAEAEAELGPVNILVNNAGVSDRTLAVDIPVETIDEVIGINLRGPFILCCEVARRLIAAGAPGRIVNIGSMGAFTSARPGHAIYSVSKMGLARMTEVLAVEWAAHFINVNAIAPGAFRSEMNAALIERLGDISQAMPRKRIFDPLELDSTLLYLVSPSSAVVTGTVIKVDDGQSGR